MATWASRKMFVTIGAGALVAVVSALLLLPLSNRSNQQAGESSTEKKELELELDHGEALPSLEKTAVAPSDEELDGMLSDIGADILKGLEHQTAVAAGEVAASAEEKVLAELDAYLAGSPPRSLGLFNWIQQASNKKKALIRKALIKRVDSSDNLNVRQTCLISLALFPEAARNIMPRSLLSDPERSVRKLAARSLATCGTPKELDALYEAAKTDKGSSLHGRDLAATAINSIGRIGGERAGQILKEIWTDRRTYGCPDTIIHSMGDSGYPGVLETVMQVLDGKPWYVRDSATYALGKLAYLNPKNTSLVDKTTYRLRRCLSDKNPRVRRMAAFSLGMVGTQQDIERLEVLLEDPYQSEQTLTEDGQTKTRTDYPVRDAARQAIDTINARIAAQTKDGEQNGISKDGVVHYSY